MLDSCEFWKADNSSVLFNRPKIVEKSHKAYLEDCTFSVTCLMVYYILSESPPLTLHEFYES